MKIRMTSENNKWSKARSTLCALALLLFVPAVLAQAYSDLKINTDTGGVYYVSASEIAAVLGVPDGDVENVISNRGLRLSNKGNAVACRYDPDGAGFFFYAEPLESVYTEYNAYMLTWAIGVAWSKIGGNTPAPVVGNFFVDTLHYEKSVYSAVSYADSPDDDYWFWSIVMAEDPTYGTATFDLNVPGVAASTKNAQMTISMFGGSQSGVSGEHHVTFELNGSKIGESTWDGIAPIDAILSFSQTLLTEGSNTLEVTGVLDAGVDFSVIYVDSIDLAYRRKFEAVDDVLSMGSVVDKIRTIDGFSSQDILIVSVDNPLSPQWMNNRTTVEDGGLYNITFRSDDQKRPFVVLEENAGMMPPAITAVDLTDLKAVSNTAEYIVITVPELAPAASNLVEYRRGKRLEGKVVFVDNIYNEFAYGVADATAIKTFLMYASANWARAPKYVLLAGEGTWDYKNHRGFDESLVPAMMSATPYGLFASDSWYADLDDDMIPDLAIGRLPAMTDSELQHMVDRIMKHEFSTVDSWHKNVAFSADNPDDAGDFHASSDRLAGVLPADYAIDKIYMHAHTVPESRTRFRNSMNAGLLLMNYFGHAGLDGLADESLFDVSDVPSLSNANMPPLVAALSCTLGRFAVPGYDCLGEEMLLGSGGGAVAIWAPSGMSYNRSLEALNKQFLKALFEDRTGVVGDAVRKCVEEYRKLDVIDYIPSIFNLLGDPAMILASIQNPSDEPYVPEMPVFRSWKTNFFTDEEMLDIVVTGDYSDPDGDGAVNIEEYYFGRNPLASDGGSGVSVKKKADDIGQEYDFKFELKRGKNVSGIDQGIKMSSDLMSWEEAQSHVIYSEVVDEGEPNIEKVNYYIRSPQNAEKYFIKVFIKKQ